MGSPDLSSSESLEYRNVLKTKLETVYYFNALFAEITRLGEFETSSEPHIWIKSLVNISWSSVSEAPITRATRRTAQTAPPFTGA